MSFPRYTRYKDSGVEWLGEVPEHWAVLAGRRIFEQRRDPALPSDEQLSATQRYGVVPQRLFMEIEDQKVVLALSGTSAFKHVQVDNFVISLRSFQGGIEHSAYSGCVSPAYTVLRPHDALYPRYWTYVLKSDGFISALQSVTDGIRDGKNVSYQQFGSIQVPVCSAPEQVAIAAFLNGETAKLDSLVAEQRRLIELLKEKRQAVISHAVTKGPNPDVPMKPTVNDAIGDVPAHWHLEKMKWIARMESGHTPDKKIPAYWENCDIPWVSLNDTGFLKDNDYISETAAQINALGIANSSARLLPAGAVVFSRDATIGRCAITTRPMAVSQHFIAWICGEKIVPEYLLLRLRSMTQELQRLTTGATVRTIGMPDVRTLVTPLPPLEEQTEIVEHIGREAGAIDMLADEAERAIALLQERRTALISAAVTGKIDVRVLVQQAA